MHLNRVICNYNKNNTISITTLNAQNLFFFLNVKCEYFMKINKFNLKLLTKVPFT